jgi:hypothetical protein
MCNSRMLGCGIWNMQSMYRWWMCIIRYSITTVDGDEGCGVRVGEQMTYRP